MQRLPVFANSLARRFVFLTLIMFCATFVSAQEVWTVTSANFAEMRVAVSAIDAAGVTVRAASGEPTQMPWDQVLELARSETRAGIPDGAWVAALVDGQRLIGTPGAMTGESITWTTQLGEFVLPIGKVVAIGRGASVRAGYGDAPAQDTLTLSNGDTIVGVVESIAADSVKIGDAPAVSWENVAILRFAGVDAAASARSAEGFLVRVVGGTVLFAETIELSGTQLKLIAEKAPPRTLAVAGVLSIEHRNGPVTWLTDQVPVESVQRPYFAATARAIKFNAGDDPEGVRDGDRSARNAITLSSYAKLTYPINPDHRAFRTRFVIDGQLPYANVVVRVYVDGKIVFEKADVSAATPVQTVQVPIDGGKKLSLEVDYGKTYDVQDRLRFIEPAFLKSLPPPTPPSNRQQ